MQINFMATVKWCRDKNEFFNQANSIWCLPLFARAFRIIQMWKWIIVLNYPSLAVGRTFDSVSKHLHLSFDVTTAEMCLDDLHPCYFTFTILSIVSQQWSEIWRQKSNIIIVTEFCKCVIGMIGIKIVDGLHKIRLLASYPMEVILLCRIEW
jgi:hypothetical protein